MGELTMDSYYVYIITDKDKNALETGLSAALSIRLLELEVELSINGNRNNCKYLLYWESHKDPLQAIARSKEVKKLSRKKKVELINKHNPEWRFLNEDIYEAYKTFFVINPVKDV